MTSIQHAVRLRLSKRPIPIELKFAYDTTERQFDDGVLMGQRCDNLFGKYTPLLPRHARNLRNPYVGPGMNLIGDEDRLNVNDSLSGVRVSKRVFLQRVFALLDVFCLSRHCQFLAVVIRSRRLRFCFFFFDFPSCRASSRRFSSH